MAGTFPAKVPAVTLAQLAVGRVRLVRRIERMRPWRARAAGDGDPLVHEQDLVRPGRKRLEPGLTGVVVDVQIRDDEELLQPADRGEIVGLVDAMEFDDELI